MPIILCPNCDTKLSVDDEFGMYTCPECNEIFDYDDANEIDQDEDDDVVEIAKPEKSSGGLVSLIILGVIIYFIFQVFSGPKWTLMVCRTLLNQSNRYECADNALILENEYKSLEECTNQGEDYLGTYPGFECGYKCKVDSDIGIMVCERINE